MLSYVCCAPDLHQSLHVPLTAQKNPTSLRAQMIHFWTSPLGSHLVARWSHLIDILPTPKDGMLREPDF